MVGLLLGCKSSCEPSSGIWRIEGSIWFTRFDDLDAFRLAKKDFEGSRICLKFALGDDGNGGREVRSGDTGPSTSSVRWICSAGKLLGRLPD